MDNGRARGVIRGRDRGRGDGNGNADGPGHARGPGGLRQGDDGRGHDQRPAGQGDGNVGMVAAADTGAIPKDIVKVMAQLDISSGEERGVGRGVPKVKRDLTLIRTRPVDVETKIGTSGNTINLLANYFALRRKPDFRLFEYHVEFGLEEERTFVRRAIVRTQDYRVMSARINHEAAEEPCEVVIKLVGERHPTDHHYIHFFNIVQKRAMEGLRLQQIGRNYYDASAAHMESAFSLEVWPGYVTSIRQHENAVLMNAEVSHRVLRTDTVLDQIRRLLQQRFGQGEVTRNLIGVVVITRYNNKPYRVDDINWNLTPASTFPAKDGTHVAYSTYYKSRYQAVVQDMGQPMLVSMPKEKDLRGGRTDPVMLVPEFCTMTGINDEMRANFKLKKTLDAYTKVDPPNRVRSLLRLANRLNEEQASVKALSDWGMQLETSLVSLPGRVLQTEDIIVGRERVVEGKADWSSDVQKGLFAAVPITKWIFIYPEDRRENLFVFWRELQSVAGGLGVQIKEPKWMEVQNLRTSTLVSKANEALDMKPTMIVVVTKDDKGDAYAALKKLMCCERPIPSQVLTVSKIINKFSPSGGGMGGKTLATKILMQMSTKLGGEPWSVNIPIKGLMVMGFDVCHDSTRKVSFGALVATINNNCSRYFSTACKHDLKVEISDQIAVMFRQALRKYKEKNYEMPAKIFFYRDGVGEGQVKQVYEHELIKIKEVLEEIAEEERPKLTFIIVSKRINTRFFWKSDNRQGGRHQQGGGEGGYSNPPPGTVVDDVVTLPERFDFFLISQTVRQGTVSPTSYNVIEDKSKSGLKPDHIQRLSYKLCFLYFNWTGTISVPAPCQYAHRLAYLCAENLHDVPHADLNELLYFL